MPVNRINVGIDYTFGFFEANTGQIINFGDIQSFKEDPIKHDVASHPYNGMPRFGYVPAGFKGSFTIKRTGPELENLLIAMKTVFYAGKNVQSGFINKWINNTDNTQSRYQYTLAVFWVGQLASSSREKEVEQTVEWMASDLVQTN